MIPDIDTRIGISVYSTGFDGIGGRIRAKPEDFAVSEALSEAAQESIRESGDYAVYLLKKTRMDTRHAVSDIFKRRGVRLKPLGLKDASAVTVQTVCATRKGRAIADLATDRYSVQRHRVRQKAALRQGHGSKPLQDKNHRMLGRARHV